MTSLYVAAISGGLPRLVLKESYTSYLVWVPMQGEYWKEKALYRRCAGPAELGVNHATHTI